MILLFLFLVFLFVAAAYVIIAALAILFTFFAVLAVLLCVLGREVTGEWPSARTVTTIAGLSFTGFLLVAAPSMYVLVGGVVGTVIAARTADA